MHGRSLIERAFRHEETNRLPRGEIWIGREALASDNRPSIHSYIEFLQKMGISMLSLSIDLSNDATKAGVDLGYQRFEVEMLKQLPGTPFFINLVIDGPFQSLVNKIGLMEVFSLAREEGKLKARIENETERIANYLPKLFAVSDSITLADDLAYDRSTYLSPHQVSKMLSGVYASLVSQVKSGGARVLFHSDGAIYSLLPLLDCCGFDGIACQVECLDFEKLKEEWGKRFTILGGIRAELLNRELQEAYLPEFQRLIPVLAKGGGLVLATSTGIYSAEEVKELARIYDLADQFWERGWNI